MYNFTDIIDRHGKDSLAVDGFGLKPDMSPNPPQEGFNAIPMWVADMNFATCPSIVQAMTKRAAHPLFGYFSPSEEYFNAVINWHTEHKKAVDLAPEHIVYQNGVLGGAVSALRALAGPGDPILINSPTYIGFTHVFENAGYRIVHSPLVRKSESASIDNVASSPAASSSSPAGAGRLRLDLADMEQKIIDNQIHVAVFCNPHNPCGRVWTAEEMAAACEVFARHDVWVIADEIWSDIILDGTHTPFQSVSEWAREHTVGLYAPSKTFNLAGLVGAYAIIYNDWLRDRVMAESSKSGYNSMNVLWQHAVIGAYTPDGAEWVRELREVIRENVGYAVSHIRAHYPGVKVDQPEGTYMLLLDCEEYCTTNGVSLDELRDGGWRVGVDWQDGRPFHAPYGLRMNLALPLELVKEAFARLDEHVFRV